MVNKFEVSFNTNGYVKSVFVFIDLIGFKDFIDKRDFSKIVGMFDFFRGEISDGKIVFDGEELRVNPAFNMFSDTIVISIPVGDIEQQIQSITEASIVSGVPLSGNLEEVFRQKALEYVFENVSKAQRSLLNHGLLSRGSVVVNDVYHNKGIWFGPAIIDGYFYESKCAVYPRVVFSETALDFFKIKNNTTSSLYKTDVDGMRYIDYFSLITNEEDVGVLSDLLLNSVENLKRDNKIYELQKWYWFGNKLGNRLEQILAIK